MALTPTLEHRIEQSETLQERKREILGPDWSNQQEMSRFEELNKIANGVTKYLQTVSQVPFDYGVHVNKQTKQAAFNYDLRLHETYRALHDIDASLAVADELRTNKTPLRYAIQSKTDENGAAKKQVREAEDIFSGTGYALAIDTAEKLLDLNRGTIDTYIDTAIAAYDNDKQEKPFPELMKANVLKTLGKQGSYGLIERAQDYLAERSSYISEDEFSAYANRIESAVQKQHDTMLEALRLFSMTAQQQEKQDYAAQMDTLHAHFVSDHLPNGEMDSDDVAYHDWVRGGQYQHYDPTSPVGLTSQGYATQKLAEIQDITNHPETKNIEYYKSFF